MAEVDVSPSNHGKPVIVRVKRKLFQSPLEAFWLEINERPLKRQNLDFAKLSISESQSTKEELNPSKVLVRHVETVNTADDSLHLVLQSVMKNSDFERKTKVDKRKKLFMDTVKQDKLLSKGKHEQEQLAKTARFEQIWRSRKGNRESTNDVLLQKACRLYDVVRVDAQGPSKKVQKPSDSSVEDYVNLNKYLPLMREIIPTAAEEVESDIRAYISSKASGDDYVYDIYAVEEEGYELMRMTTLIMASAIQNMTLMIQMLKATHCMTIRMKRLLKKRKREAKNPMRNLKNLNLRVTVAAKNLWVLNTTRMFFLRRMMTTMMAMQFTILWTTMIIWKIGIDPIRL